MAPTTPNNPNNNNYNNNNEVDNSGFEEVASSNLPRSSTISIALPSSILSNAQSPELRMYLAGQVARTAAIYNVDEVIIFSEHSSNYKQHRQRKPDIPSEVTKFFATVLQYLETPQYLRKHLFPMSAELRLVGLLNPLALPTHHSRNDHPRYREGVFITSSRNHQQQQQQSSRYVDVGLDRPVEVDKPYPSGTRATIDLSVSGAGPTYSRAPGKYLFGRVVPKEANTGIYNGYHVRTASALSGVFSGSKVAARGYDLTIGTSERGTHISASGKPSRSFALPEFSHLLIVFGGVHGLERSVIGDDTLEELGIVVRPEQVDDQGNGRIEQDGHDQSAINGNAHGISNSNSNNDDGVGSNVGDLFDFYLNTCPQQGSKTIRTEEAILLSLTALQPFLNAVDCF